MKSRLKNINGYPRALQAMFLLLLRLLAFSRTQTARHQVGES